MSKISNYYKQRTAYGVTGWIRELQKELTSTVPYATKKLCINYVGSIDGENICFCGSKLKSISVAERIQPTKLLCTNNYQYYRIVCDLCDYQIRISHFVKQILYCDSKSKLHPGGFDKCYPKCLIPHQNGLKVRGYGNCRCKKCQQK